MGSLSVGCKVAWSKSSVDRNLLRTSVSPRQIRSAPSRRHRDLPKTDSSGGRFARSGYVLGYLRHGSFGRASAGGPTDRGAWPSGALARDWPGVTVAPARCRASNGLAADRMAPGLAAVALPACSAVLGSPAACPARRWPDKRALGCRTNKQDGARQSNQ
jgi:hypothetical protein